MGYPDYVKKISNTYPNPHNYDPTGDWYCGYVIIPHFHTLSKMDLAGLYELGINSLSEITYKDIINSDTINEFILLQENSDNYITHLVIGENMWLPDGPGIERVKEGMVMIGFDTMMSLKQNPEEHEKYTESKLRELREDLERIFLENVNKI